ncbi:MAG: DNA polymerase IV [Anaerolineae bacterium]|nr:MAG: DNA polymerase IV [Anaerolineae bacterium]
MPRKIIHFDLDAFFCAVEELHNPALRGQPFAVGGRPDERGVVASCSYAARALGVRSAMPMARALRQCPTLQIIPGHHGQYREKSRQVMAILREITPLIEQLSIDEAFLDVTDRPEKAGLLARQIQQRVLAEADLPCSLGVATNKLVAKIATDVGKAARKTSTYPNAIQIVPPGQEAAFLSLLPAEMLWGVGPKTASRLAELGIHTIGDLARWPSADLARHFGQNGRDLAARARGEDDRSIETARETKSISQEITFSRDVSDSRKLYDELKQQSERVAKQLKQENLLAGTVKIKLRWPDFTTLTRQSTLSVPTDEAGQIHTLARRLLDQNWTKGKAVRLLGVGVSGLQPPSHQLSLWDAPNAEKARKLEDAVNDLQKRFGPEIIHKGRDQAGK